VFPAASFQAAIRSGKKGGEITGKKQQTGKPQKKLDIRGENYAYSTSIS
jgi:hypothetical protein